MNKSILAITFFIVIAVFTLNIMDSYGQAGSIDSSFYNHSGLSYIRSFQLQPDGKIVAVGLFGLGIRRLFSDGSVDSSFNPGSGFDNPPYAVALQSDGKVIAGGSFTTYNSISAPRLVRLFSDGTIDTTFNVGTGPNNDIENMAILSDGKIIIVGRFNTYNGTTAKYIARLNTDGSIDSTFNTITGAGNFITDLSIQPDGKIIIGGAFINYKGYPRSKIARLNPDASCDTTFNPGTGGNRTVWTTTLQADGKILIGGLFLIFNGDSVPGYTRLNSDGSRDTAFHPQSAIYYSDTVIYAMTQQPDGKILVGGTFGVNCICNYANFMRLLPDGTLDTSFRYRTPPNVGVYSLSMLPDNKIMMGGAFTSYDSTTAPGMTRILNDITLNIHNDNGYDSANPEGFVFPNPFTTQLTIATGLKPETTIALFDITGKEIITAKATNEKTVLNAESIAAGLYFLRVEDGSGVWNYKVVKEN